MQQPVRGGHDGATHAGTLRKLSLAALLVAVGVQGIFVFSQATAILLDGVSEAVVKVLS